MRTDINIWTDDQPLKARHDEGDGFLWLTTADDTHNRSLSIFGNAGYLSRLAAAINSVVEQPTDATGYHQDDLTYGHQALGANADLDDEIPF